MIRAAGIDQSYTGFGFSVDGEAKKRSFPPGRYDNVPEARLIGIRKWFTDWLTLQHRAGISIVAMEGYASNAKFGREMAGELGGVVKMVVWEVTGKSALIVPPTSLKKFVTGSGAGKKNVMIAHVYKRWGEMFSDDNQADAFALEKFGVAYVEILAGATAVYPKFQIEAVEAVHAKNLTLG